METVKNPLWKEFNLIDEVLKTYSKKDSFLSSKKIERSISFKMATGILFLWFIVKMFLCRWVSCEIGATDVCLVAGTIYGYGAYNSYQIRKDKPSNNDNTPSDADQPK